MPTITAYEHLSSNVSMPYSAPFFGCRFSRRQAHRSPSVTSITIYEWRYSRSFMCWRFPDLSRLYVCHVAITDV